MATGNDDFMWNTAGLEGNAGETSHFHRMIDEFIVVGAAVETEPLAIGAAGNTFGERHGRCDLPVAIGCAGRRLEFDEAGRILLANDLQENTGAVEEGMRRVEVRPAHRKIPSIDVDADG